MNLKMYLFLKEMSLQQFCKKHCLGYAHLSRMLGGKVDPSPKILMHIWLATDKEVLPEMALVPTIQLDFKKIQHAA